MCYFPRRLMDQLVNSYFIFVNNGSDCLVYTTFSHNLMIGDKEMKILRSRTIGKLAESRHT